MATYEYLTVDFFTAVRFGGNPLAVVTDARRLGGEQMQRIATEFNYSESTFVLPPDDPANSARVRIFTPTTEIPFAGHPNVGTGYVLGRLGDLIGKPLDGWLRFRRGSRSRRDRAPQARRQGRRRTDHRARANRAGS